MASELRPGDLIVSPATPRTFHAFNSDQTGSAGLVPANVALLVIKPNEHIVAGWHRHLVLFEGHLIHVNAGGTWDITRSGAP